MKNIYLTLAIVIFSFLSCQKEQTDKNGQVTFSLNTIGNQLKSSGSCGNPFWVVVTIKDKSGKELYSKKAMQLLNMNGSYISSPVSLVVGEYELDDFFITDSSNNIIYSAPKANSPMAYLVTSPLNSKFIVSEDAVTKLSPEVLCAVHAKPEDFGYTTFSFQIVKTFDFLLGVFVYNEVIQNFEMANSTITIKINGLTLMTQNLTNITNQITLPDNNPEFEIIISKSGYKTFSQKYTAADLKTHFTSSQAGPLIVKLEKGCLLPSGLIAYFPFNGNVNDQSGNKYNGTATNITIGNDRFGMPNSSCDLSGNTGYMTIGNNFDLPQKTISLWFMCKGFKSGVSFVNIYSSDNGSISYGDTYLGIYNNGDGTYSLQYAYNVGTWDVSNEFKPDVKLNTWYHAVIAVDDKTINYYLNGTLLKSLPNAHLNIHSVDGFSTTNIGTSRNCSNRYLYGSIDEVMIYNRALTGSEVNNLYQCN